MAKPRIPARIVNALAKAGVGLTTPAAEGRAYLVIGPHVWGKGNTFEKAYANARREGPDVEKKLILLDVPANATVDAMGYTTWTWEKDQPKPEPDKELLRIGV